MEKNRKIFIICFFSFMVMMLYGCNSLVEKAEKPKEQIETELNQVENENLEEGKNQEEQKDFEELNEIKDISKYSYIVKGNGEIDVEIISSENYAKEKWMIEIINKFNEQKNLVEGKTISVSLKSIPSEIIFENIVSGKYVPKAIIPKNDFLPEMLKTKKFEFYQESEVLLKDVLGFVIDEGIYNFLLEKYGDVNFKLIQQRVLNDEIKIGIIADDINSLDFVISTLYSLDSQDLISDMAIEQFEKFKLNLVKLSEKKYILYNLDNGYLNGAILDYNTFVRIPEVSEYIFIPFGVVNNNPLYCNENISEQEKRIIKLFKYYATSTEAKKLAKDCGFITNGNYVSEVPFIEGDILLEIGELFNDKI